MPALTRLSKIYARAGDWDRCKATLEQALKVTGPGPSGRDAAELFFRLGEVARLGDADAETAILHFQQALKHDPGLLDAVAALRARGIATPVVLFGYYNPIFVMGAEVFAARAAQAGVDAVLTVDLPIDEIAELAQPLAAHGIDVIPLVAPTSTPDRVARLGELRAPFVYYISLTGVTGTKAAAAVDPARLQAIRDAANAPVAVGFGIRTPDDARRFSAIADGVVVGSALVDRVADGPAAGAPQRVADLVRALAAAMPR